MRVPAIWNGSLKALSFGSKVEIIRETPVLAVIDEVRTGPEPRTPGGEIGIANAARWGFPPSRCATQVMWGRGRMGGDGCQAGLFRFISSMPPAAPPRRLFGGVDRRIDSPYAIGVPRPGEEPLISTSRHPSSPKAGPGGEPGRQALPPNALIAPDGTMSGDPAAALWPARAKWTHDYKKGEGAIRAFGTQEAPASPSWWSCSVAR